LLNLPIAQARKNNPELEERLISGRLENSVFADQQFDAICLWDVMSIFGIQQ